MSEQIQTFSDRLNLGGQSSELTREHTEFSLEVYGVGLPLAGGGDGVWGWGSGAVGRDYFQGRHLGYRNGSDLNSDIRGKSWLSHAYFLFLVQRLS